MTPEQAGLLRKAESGVRAAHLLAREGFAEVAVARASAAMFQAAEALLLDEGLAFSRPSATVLAFGERYVRRGRIPAEYHRYLLDAQDARRMVDYDIGEDLDAREAAEQVARAERFLDLAGKRLGRVPAGRAGG